jgi:hypothetical protein
MYSGEFGASRELRPVSVLVPCADRIKSGDYSCQRKKYKHKVPLTSLGMTMLLFWPDGMTMLSF